VTEKHSRQQGFCKIRATEYRLKYIWNSNRLLYLGRINEKVTAKRTAEILIPVLRKAPNVARHPMGHSPTHEDYNLELQYGFQKKSLFILTHQPDILIIVECEHPDKLVYTVDTRITDRQFMVREKSS
jgi:hypothetical protein